mmetsp:Transcript_5062/g.6507  ORF Transcript_5062/g.6507 Transcript_5062/m.6507 type:complete len:201 (+) Transcript_5062:35-637(+)
MPRFGAPSPKQIAEQALKNDSSLTAINLSGNAIFKMKSYENCKIICEALANNEYVKELNLSQNEITDADCEWLKKLFENTKTLQSVNLEGNKISSDGCVLLAQGMNSNESITMLNVMNQGPFGEACMDAWLDTFNVNISLIDLKWRVSSRKSFALNAAITRNRSIQRLRSSGKDWTSLLPDSLKKKYNSSRKNTGRTTTT